MTRQGSTFQRRTFPSRLERYGARVAISRVALVQEDTVTGGFPSFDADTKRGDLRHDCFRRNYGHRCWELDALSPPVLRQRVREAIRDLVDTVAWEHCRRIEAAEHESLRRFKWS